MSTATEQVVRADLDMPSFEAIGRAFIEAYARGDRAAILGLCAPDADTHYVPWGEAGRNPIAAAVDVWAGYPAAFDGFAMPILSWPKTRRVVSSSSRR